MSNDNTIDTMPDLTLEPDIAAPEMQPTPLKDTENAPAQTRTKTMEENLSPQELKMVSDFAQKIDIKNSTHILQYGAGSQKKMLTFSESALNKVQGKDLDEVGNMVTNLVTELKDFSPDQEGKKGFFANLFSKPAKKADQLRAQYSSVESNVDRIANELEKHKVVLLKDIAMLDRMYDMNLDYFKELTLYILAGKKKLEEAETVELPAMKAKAAESGLSEEAQAANDFAAQINRFDKKLHDLELTRNISLQMGPQIRMVQNNDAMMVEKIQSSIVNTIPLWKNQMVLTLGLAHSKRAIDAQRQVTDVTNELLKKNAEKLKTSTIEAAKESERGIVDIETLQMTNQSLISTLDEVLQIQQEGYQKRRQAEEELQRIESDLKNKLLEVRDVSVQSSPVKETPLEDETSTDIKLELPEDSE